MQYLKRQVVQTIRSNQRLKEDIKAMDTKIGLLVKNRLALQKVSRQLRNEKSGFFVGEFSGLKANQERMEVSWVKGSSICRLQEV